ncbi:sugar-binding transcriptional regulator [Hutsoniella sourekii]|uniref:sugar-binding transcriptional regulator n=1 Tax=Hutsoniella sourekii TaxID=87650 RepID=UPI000482C06C|nr:sugar-binding transcriptional regulator [Hutsoniella sourekii]
MAIDQEIVKVATMYYEEGLTQAEIARQRGVSRSLIAKYLNDAKQAGIVHIHISSESIHSVRLARQLEKKYQLTNAIVVDSYDLKAEEVQQIVSQQAAHYLNEHISKYPKVGVSWGRTLRRVIDALPYQDQGGLTITPLIGGLSDQYFDIQSNQLCYDLARKTRGQASYLYAPALAKNHLLYDELIHNSAICATLQSGRKVDLALIGISSLHQENNMLRIGYINQNDVDRLELEDAVGVINSIFFDRNGMAVDDPINKSVVGLPLDAFIDIPEVMAVVTGDQKALAIHSALNANHISILVTTDTLASKLLTL